MKFGKYDLKQVTAVVEAYAILTGDNLPDSEVLFDLLRDLKHWAEWKGVAFDEALTRAGQGYLAERTHPRLGGRTD